MNFVEVENVRMELATYSATYAGMKSHFHQTLIKFGALSTKMMLNYIFFLDHLEGQINVKELGTQ